MIPDPFCCIDNNLAVVYEMIYCCIFYLNLHRKWIYTTFQKYGVGMIFFKMFLNEVSYVHQVCIYLIKKYCEIVTILNNFFNFNIF